MVDVVRVLALLCCVACVYGGGNFAGSRVFRAPGEFMADVVAYYVHVVNIQPACFIKDGAEFPENTMNGDERTVKADELLAFTLRVREVNIDVLTASEEKVRQQLRAEGGMYGIKVKNILAHAQDVSRRRTEQKTPRKTHDPAM